MFGSRRTSGHSRSETGHGRALVRGRVGIFTDGDCFDLEIFQRFYDSHSAEGPENLCNQGIELTLTPVTDSCTALSGERQVAFRTRPRHEGHGLLSDADPASDSFGRRAYALGQDALGERVLGKWRLDRLIGIGGMAAVFEATHPNGNRVAIKILHPDLAGFDEIRERFLAEGYAANRVAHPGAVTVRDEGTTEDGAVFLVMDLLRGQTLAERLEPSSEPLSVGPRSRLPRSCSRCWRTHTTAASCTATSSPENIFLTNEGRVRLLDFGIARIETARRSHETQAGTTLGTPAFMPPEQALGRWDALDGRSDLWSLGATMYLVLMRSTRA